MEAPTKYGGFVRPAASPRSWCGRRGYVSKLAPLDSHTMLYTATAADGAGPWLWALDVERGRSRRVMLGARAIHVDAASANGRRLVATVARPQASLWSVPIGSRPAGPARPYPVPGVRVMGTKCQGHGAVLPVCSGDSRRFLAISRGRGRVGGDLARFARGAVRGASTFAGWPTGGYRVAKRRAAYLDVRGDGRFTIQNACRSD